MEDYNKYLELFDKKYNNELTGVEEKNFEKRLEEDNAFKVEFDKYMEMINSMHFGAAEITKKELDNIKSQLEAEGFFDKIPETELIPSNTTSKQKTAQVSKVIPSKNNRRLPWPLGIAASFLLLIGAYGYIATNYSNNALADTTSLYAARGVERGGRTNQ